MPKSQKNNTILLHLPRQSCSLYEKQDRASSVSWCTHSEHPHTSEPHSELHKLKRHIRILKQEKHELYFITQIPLKSLIVARTSPAAEVEQPAPLLAAVFRKGRAQTLPSQADFPPLSRKSHEHPLRVLYGPVLSFLLLSPRGAMATFSCLFNDCGWTINILHTSKHSTTPTSCCRLNSEGDGKDSFTKKKKRERHELENRVRILIHHHVRARFKHTKE